MIGVSVDQVASAAKVSTNTIRRAEACQKETRLTAANLAAIRDVYESVGIEFLNSDSSIGVKLYWAVLEEAWERSRSAAAEQEEQEKQAM